MQNIASDLFLLTTNLSQLKGRDQIVRLFIESINEIFPTFSFHWYSGNDNTSVQILPISTRTKTYGHIQFEETLRSNEEFYALFQNATQLVAILLERLEQEELLNSQRAHLQHLVDEQTNHLIEKQDELNEMNEELATLNEDLIETNKSLLEVNLNLQNEIIEREKVEKKLRDSDKFFHHANDMLCIAGFDGYFKMLNPAWSKTLGWSTEELLSKPWNDFIHPDDIERTNNVKSTIVDGEELYLFENRYICKDGSSKWLSWSSFPNLKEGIMFGVARDVTKLKQAEEELKKSEHHAREVADLMEGLFNAIPDIIGLQDASHNIIRYNDAGYRFLNINQDQINGKHCYELIGLTHLCIECATSEAIETKEPAQIEKFIPEMGIWIEARSYPIINQKGEITNIVEHLRDITDRKKTEELLLESEKLFSTIFYNSPEAIIMTSRGDGKIIDANNTFLSSLEFTRDEVVGKPIGELGIFNDPGVREKLIEELMKNGFVSDFECSFRSKTGKITTGLMSMSFIMYNGKPHQLTTVIDITERKKAERALEYSHNRLEEAQKIAKIGNWEANLITGELYWSEEIFNIFGFDSKSFSPNVKAFYESVHPDDRNKVLESEKLSEQTGLHDVVHRIIRTTGEIRFVHELARRYADDVGNPIMLKGTVQDVSERVQTMEELKNKEILLNLTGKMAKVGGWEFDVSTLKQTWTEEVYRIHEVDLDFDQNVEKGINFYAPGSREIIQKAVQCAIEFGEPYDLELEIITFKGNHRWVHSIGNAYQENGKTIKVFGSFQDITESKLSEIKLRDSERLLNESQKVSKIGSYTQNLDSGIWIGSDYLNEIFGIDAKSSHSVEEWLEVIHPADRAMMESYFKNEVVGNRGRFDKEYRIISKNIKMERWVHGIGELEFDIDGNPIRMIGTIRDNTENKRVELELRKLQRAVEQSPDSIIITNYEGEIEYANPAILILTGYSNEELIGKNQRIFSSGQMKKKEYIELWKTISSGQVWQGEFQNRKKNGELFWQSATISPIFDDKGVITHYLSISEDITEKKKLTLELIKAKEHAEESDRLKSSFLANMSHEIRTPMNSIMGFASLLPEEESRELMCQYANIIVQNSEQLVSLIDGIVMYSKLQTGLFAYRPVLFLAHNLFNDIQQSFNLPVYQKGVSLKFIGEIDKTTQIYSDYDKLRQIITNLTVNAFKYTHKGEIILGCDHKGDCFEFYVRDTGIGIPQKDIPHIFERFYRGSNIDEAISRGTGLGLCIVKELVEMLGGVIWAESEEGKGSTFHFTIPLQLSN